MLIRQHNFNIHANVHHIGYLCVIGLQPTRPRDLDRPIKPLNGPRVWIWDGTPQIVRRFWSLLDICLLDVPPSVAARRCLPPGANVYFADPANQISCAIMVFFRIPDMGVWTNPWRSPPLQSLTFPFLHCPVHLPIPKPFPSLISSPLKSSYKAWESVVSSPRGVWGGAPAEIEFGTF